MPYVNPQTRANIDKELKFPFPQYPGDLNYILTKIIAKYLEGPISYSDLNSAIGVLECAKLELYRRVVAPYENIKMKENGDVY